MKLSTFLFQTARHFAQCTSVAGFGQIVRSSHRCESAFWLLAIVAGIYLTIRDCRAPILGYLNEDSLSTIDFQRNETLSFRGASFCLELDTAQLIVRNFSRLDDDAELRRFSNCLQNRACFELESFYDGYTDQIIAATKLLSIYGVLENGRKVQKGLRTRSAAKIPPAFREHFVREGITSRYLTQTIAYLLCKRMRIEVKYFEKDNMTVQDFCSIVPLVWFGVPPRTTDETDVLCYLVEDLTVFPSMEEKYEVSFSNPDTVFPQAEANSSHATLWNHAYLSVDGVPIVSDLSSDYAWITYGECTRVQIELVLRVTLLSKNSRKCNVKENFLKCLGRCKVAETAAVCNCSAVSWGLYVTDEVKPTMLENGSCFTLQAPHEYEACTEVVRASPRREACNRRCLHRCEANVFRVIDSGICQFETVPNRTSVVYNLHRASYTHIREQLTYEVSNLVSSIGGIVGLWLGAGFIGLMEAAIFLPKALVELAICRRRKPRVEAPVKTDEDVLKRLCRLENELAKVTASIGYQRFDCALKKADDKPATLVRF